MVNDEMHKIRCREYQADFMRARSLAEMGYGDYFPTKTPFQEHMEAKEQIKRIGERDKIKEQIESNLRSQGKSGIVIEKYDRWGKLYYEVI